ncbi:MAG: hypothetical protein ABI581_09105 [Sediminibacterium sp.]
MRKLLLLAFMPMACMLAIQTWANDNPVSDSAKITHVTDGKIDEWKIEKFETDPDSKVQYAIDHDGENLYVAMKISDKFVQQKIMAFGMSMMIDKKGKKKEGSGIEFPLKAAMSAFNRGGGGGSDPREAREKRASAMIFLKAFGLDNLDGEKTYLISQPGLVNVDFTWDDADNMYIEYLVPFMFLGSTASLNGKPLSIGWKMREGSGPGGANSGGDASGATNRPVTTTTGLVAVPAGTTPSTSTSSRGGGGRGGGGGRLGGNLGASSSFEPSFKEAYIWTKYTLTF